MYICTYGCSYTDLSSEHYPYFSLKYFNINTSWKVNKYFIKSCKTHTFIWKYIHKMANLAGRYTFNFHMISYVFKTASIHSVECGAHSVCKAGVARVNRLAGDGVRWAVPFSSGPLTCRCDTWQRRAATCPRGASTALYIQSFGYEAATAHPAGLSSQLLLVLVMTHSGDVIISRWTNNTHSVLDRYNAFIRDS